MERVGKVDRGVKSNIERRVLQTNRKDRGSVSVSESDHLSHSIHCVVFKSRYSYETHISL